MKTKDNSFWLNFLKTFLIVCIILVLIVAFDNRNKKESEPEETKVVEKETETFRQSELTLWDLFIKEAKQQGYIIEEELESIELVSIKDYGKYIKERPNIRYEEINFKFTCKDKTENCITPKLKQITEAKPVYKKLVIIDLDKNYIQIVDGFTFKMSDNLVPIDGPFTFPGEE